jgi:hypothetical protein
MKEVKITMKFVSITFKQNLGFEETVTIYMDILFHKNNPVVASMEV